MAATLTSAGELTYASFPIEKVETDADGDLIVFGKASDGSIDSDQQIVDPSWMARAAQAWKDSGANLRVQHNAQRDPAGVGLEVETDATGATWVKGLVVEPVAKKLVAKGALRAYSVGISRPTITRDAAARGGRITDGELVEISLVDRPANKRCGIQLVKSEGGIPEYTGTMFGADDDIAKALDGEVLEKGAGGMLAEAQAPATVDISSFQMPEDLSITFTPADLARMVQNKFVQRHYDDLARQAASQTRDDTGRPGGETVGDAEKGSYVDEPVTVEADTPDAAEKTADAPAEQQEAVPDVTKDPAPRPVKKAKKKPKKLPPWLNKPSDGDSGDDAKDDDASKACKSATDHLWTGVEGTSDIVCSKCHTSPADAAGVAASPMQAAPVKELQESDGPASTKGATPASASGAVAESMKPVPAHREPDGAAAETFEADAGMEDGDSMKAADLAPDPELAALIRFKTLGIDEDLGRLHDLTCPAYSPDMAAKYHPFASLPALIDSGTWQRKTLAAAGGPLEKAIEMAELWQAVHVLKGADQAALNDHRLELHKAFRDANPGPGSFPTPGCVSPQRYQRPVLTDGRAATATDYGTPNTSPQVATSPPNAQNFDRPPLGAGHQSPSPSFMKGGGAQYPAQQGVPQRISYEQVERDRARRSLSMLHDHLNHMFPSACPMVEQDAYRQPESRAVPSPAGIGKTADPAEAPAAFKATPEDGDMFADAEVYKGYKKMRKKLGKKVLAGKMTVDEARARMGRQFAQKGNGEPQEAAQKSAGVPVMGQTVTVRPGQEPLLSAPSLNPVASNPAFDPEVIKTVVTEATSDLKDLLVKQQRDMAAQQEDFTAKLADQQRVIDAIADQPDPSTAAFSGLAFQPQVIKSRRPAAVPDQAEYAARAQQMVRRNLQNTYSTHSNPYVREAAGEALANLGAGTEASMT